MSECELQEQKEMWEAGLAFHPLAGMVPEQMHPPCSPCDANLQDLPHRQRATPHWTSELTFPVFPVATPYTLASPLKLPDLYYHHTPNHV